MYSHKRKTERNEVVRASGMTIVLLLPLLPFVESRQYVALRR